VRLLQLAREAWVSGLASAVPFLLIAAVALAMCATSVITVGRTAAAEADVLASLKAEGSQVLTVVDSKDEGVITSAAVAVLQTSSYIERVVGLSAPFDTTSAAIGAGGTRVPAWTVVGDVKRAASVVQGRYPRPGEAMVSVDALATLGLEFPIGALADGAGRQFPIVGSFDSTSGDLALNAGAFIASDGDRQLASIRIEITDYRRAAEVQELTLGLITPSDPDTLHIDSPTSLAALQGDILGGLGASNRVLLLLVVGAGALVIATVCLSDTLIRRKELGRRRALGISRLDLIALVVLRNSYPAAIGAVIGVSAGAVVSQLQGAVPPPDFLAGTAVLAVVASVIAALLPAVAASLRDPVRILRMP
jgi:putative ABC transport system permease protein